MRGRSSTYSRCSAQEAKGARAEVLSPAGCRSGWAPRRLRCAAARVLSQAALGAACQGAPPQSCLPPGGAPDQAALREVYDSVAVRPCLACAQHGLCCQNAAISGRHHWCCISQQARRIAELTCTCTVHMQGSTACQTELKRACSAASLGLEPKWMTYLPASVNSSLPKPWKLRSMSASTPARSHNLPSQTWCTALTHSAARRAVHGREKIRACCMHAAFFNFHC